MSKRSRSSDSSSSSDSESPRKKILDDDEKGETSSSFNNSVAKISLSTCALCNRDLNSKDSPKLLECLHAVCVGCIRNNTNIIICQLCHVHSHVDNLVENKFFTKFLEKDSNLKKNSVNSVCSNCEESVASNNWCMDCEGWICDICAETHSKLKITKNHVIKSKNQMAENKKSENLDLFCTIHPQEQLSLYCTVCDRLTCRNCQLFSHRDHSYKFHNEVVEDIQTIIETLSDEIGKKKQKLEKAKHIIEERQALTLNGKETIVLEINKLIDQMKYLVSIRGKELTLQLEKKSKEVQELLDGKKNNIDKLLKECDRCMALMSFVSQGENSLELLYSKKSIQNHLSKIIATKADVPNPKIPVDIHLIVDNLPFLRNQIASIGQIIFDGKIISHATIDHINLKKN